MAGGSYSMHSKCLPKERTFDQEDYRMKDQGKSTQAEGTAKEIAVLRGQNKGQCGRKGVNLKDRNARQNCRMSRAR